MSKNKREWDMVGAVNFLDNQQKLQEMSITCLIYRAESSNEYVANDAQLELNRRHFNYKKG